MNIFAWATEIQIRHICKIIILVAGLVLVSAEKSETRRFETKIKTKTRGFETKTETKTKQTGLETGLETKTSLETSNTGVYVCVCVCVYIALVYRYVCMSDVCLCLHVINYLALTKKIDTCFTTSMKNVPNIVKLGLIQEKCPKYSQTGSNPGKMSQI